MMKWTFSSSSAKEHYGQYWYFLYIYIYIGNISNVSIEKLNVRIGVILENRASFFSRLSACTFRHEGGPYTILNLRYLIYNWCRAHEPQNKQKWFPSTEKTFELKRLESAMLRPPCSIFRKKNQVKIRRFYKKFSYLPSKLYFSIAVYSDSEWSCDVLSL